MLTTEQRADRYRRQNALTGRTRLTARQLRQIGRMALRRGESPATWGDREPYFCPTSGEVESPDRGGFDVCCGRPELHRATGEEVCRGDVR